MATSRMRSRKNIISVYHREPNIDSPPGAQKLARAFADRDLEALAKALEDYPGVWKTDLLQVNDRAEYKREVSGPAAHYAVLTNWHQALPVLHAGGDPLTAPHPDGGRSVIEQAAHKARPSALAILLSLGVPMDPNRALAYLSRSSTMSEPMLLRCAQRLVAAGADPWARVSDSLTGQGGLRSLPSIAMSYRHCELAIWLIRQQSLTSTTEELLDREFVKDWRIMMVNGQHPQAAYDALAQVLIEHRCVGSLVPWFNDLSTAGRSLSVYAGCPGHYKALTATLSRFLDEGVPVGAVDIAEVNEHWHTLSQHPELAASLARCQQQILEQDTPVTAPPTRRGGPRL